MKHFDATDRTILLALQRDARQTTAELAEQVSLSQSPCWRRVRQLEDSGVIEGYHARLNRKRLGFGVTGFIHIQMNNHTPEQIVEFEREVAALAQVVSCYNLSGNYDFMLEVIAVDLEAFSHLVHYKIRCLPGVREISTNFVMKEVKRTGILPVE